MAAPAATTAWTELNSKVQPPPTTKLSDKADKQNYRRTLCALPSKQQQQQQLRELKQN